jgi:hypothetical protein
MDWRVFQFGNREDEQLAAYANWAVRRCIDKHAISYEDYKKWRRRNPLIFTTVVDDKNELIGFFDIFPIESAVGQKIIEGKLSEHSLALDHLVPVERTFSRLVAKEIVLLH